MRNECAIVRDLMPLCIDHAASPDSQALVEEHIQTCESCAEIYGEMTRALPKLQSLRDSRELARTVRQMRRRKKLRTGAVVCCVFLIGALLGVSLLNWLDVRKPAGTNPTYYVRSGAPVDRTGNVVEVEYVTIVPTSGQTVAAPAGVYLTQDGLASFTLEERDGRMALVSAEGEEDAVATLCRSQDSLSAGTYLRVEDGMVYTLTERDGEIVSEGQRFMTSEEYEVLRVFLGGREMPPDVTVYPAASTPTPGL